MPYREVINCRSMSKVLSGIYSWHSFWHLFWHSFGHSIWHNLWHSFWHLFRHSFWHYIIYQASTRHSDILFGILSGTCLGARALKNASGAGEGWCSGPWSSGPTSTTQGGWVQSCCSWAWAIRFKRAPCWCQGLAFGMETVLFFLGGRWSENCGLTNQNGDFDGNYMAFFDGMRILQTTMDPENPRMFREKWHSNSFFGRFYASWRNGMKNIPPGLDASLGWFSSASNHYKRNIYPCRTIHDKLDKSSKCFEDKCLLNPPFPSFSILFRVPNVSHKYPRIDQMKTITIIIFQLSPNAFVWLFSAVHLAYQSYFWVVPTAPSAQRCSETRWFASAAPAWPGEGMTSFWYIA